MGATHLMSNMETLSTAGWHVRVEASAVSNRPWAMKVHCARKSEPGLAGYNPNNFQFEVCLQNIIICPAWEWPKLVWTTIKDLKNPSH